jgi:hypothetical protein
MQLLTAHDHSNKKRDAASNLWQQQQQKLCNV